MAEKKEDLISKYEKLLEPLAEERSVVYEVHDSEVVEAFKEILRQIGLNPKAQELDELARLVQDLHADESEDKITIEFRVGSDAIYLDL